MTPHTTTEGMTRDASTESTESLRDEMCRIIDEIGTSRSDRMPILKARFDELWKKIGEPLGEPSEPTLH